MNLPPVFAPIWKRRWGLLVFATWFQLLENLLFIPAMGFLGSALRGRPVVDSTALVEFFLSPRGFLVLFLAATLSLTLRLLEHAGLSAMVLGALEGKTLRTWEVLGWLARELPRLGRIGARIVGWGLVLVTPLLAVAGWLVPRLLKRHDINYYLAHRPAEFVSTAAVIGVVALATLVGAVWLLVRWRLVVQVCAFDRRDGREAFREAAVLSRGVWTGMAGRCAAVLAILGALVVTAAALQQLAVWLVLQVAGGAGLPLAVSFGTIVLLRTAIGAVVTSLGACADAAIFATFYARRRNELGGRPSLPAGEAGLSSGRSVPGWAKGFAAGLVVAMLIAAGVSTSLAVQALGHHGPITVTAHRGDHRRAPENTLAAVREAIRIGADSAEIDVQLSKDGVLVVTHDSDFSRMAGVAKRVWELTYAEIRAIPLGRMAAVEFRSEAVPTLDDVLAVVDRRIRLNIELKYYGDHQPRLAERVAEAIRARQMSGQVIIQCLEYGPLLEVRRYAPEIPVGYLMSLNARDPGRLEVDFLGAELNRVSGSFVQAAHRRGQRVHVWTVDKATDMQRMIDLGVDDLITNEPEEALRQVRAQAHLTPPERLLRRMHAWMAD